MSVNDAPLLGIDPEHMPAFLALLTLPVLLWLAFRLTHRACGRGFAPAVRFVNGYNEATLAERLTALLLLGSGLIHLVLAFTHGGELAGPFLMDGMLLTALSCAVITTRRWRLPAALLLAANLIVYASIIGHHREPFDQLGMTTKLAELLALALTLSPLGLSVRHRLLSWAVMVVPVFGLGIVVGGTSWVASVSHVEAAEGAHLRADGLQDAITGRTSPDQAYADRLVAETRAAVARYADISVAFADGYKGNFSRKADLPHFDNPGYQKDGRVLDPEHPEELVYVKTKDGPLLVGVVYVMPRAGERGPSVGAPEASWHTHTLCVTPLPGFITGLLPPTGMCSTGAVNVVTPEMIHVWLVDNPGGPFAHNLDKATIKALQNR